MNDKVIFSACWSLDGTTGEEVIIDGANDNTVRFYRVTLVGGVHSSLQCRVPLVGSPPVTLTISVAPSRHVMYVGPNQVLQFTVANVAGLYVLAYDENAANPSSIQYGTVLLEALVCD